MQILIINLFIVYISSFFSRLNLKSKKLMINHKAYNYIFIIISLISLIFVSGFRISGTDYGTYTHIYRSSTDINLADSNDIGFIILCKILNRISDNPQIMFFICALITNILIVITIKKYSSKYELSMWLYITTFIYYSTFNGVRQWLAAAIIFSASKYLFKREFKKYLSIVLLASTIHMSALVMIPIYFIVNNKPFSKNNLIIVSLFVLATIMYIPFLNILFTLLEGTQYAHYFDIMSNSENGIHPLRLLVYAMPIIIYSIFYNKINRVKNKESDIVLNLCIIGFLIMLLSLRQVFFARMIFYFEPYYLILIPKLLNFNGIKLNRLLYYIIMILYFLYSYLLLKNGEAYILPYRLNIDIF